VLQENGLAALRGWNCCLLRQPSFA